MDLRTEFKLRFKDPISDWTMILRTTEPKQEEEIKKIIKSHAQNYDASKEDFSPVDIMDDICEEYGWEWEDYEYQEIEILDEEWFGYIR